MHWPFMQPHKPAKKIFSLTLIEVSVELADSSAFMQCIFRPIVFPLLRKDARSKSRIKVASHEDRLVRLSSAIIATAALLSLESELSKKVRSDLAERITGH